MTTQRTIEHVPSASHEVDFDIVKVNRVREQVRRGAFRVDAQSVAERLLSDHLLWSWVLGASQSRTRESTP